MKVLKKDLEKLLRRQIENIVYGLIFFICLVFWDYQYQPSMYEIKVSLVISWIVSSVLFLLTEPIICNKVPIIILNNLIGFLYNAQKVFALVIIYLLFYGKIGLTLIVSIELYLFIEWVLFFIEKRINQNKLYLY